MLRKTLLMALVAALLATGCRKMERFTFIRPSAERGEFTPVAPTYDVSGKPSQTRVDRARPLVVAATDRLRRGELDEAERLAGQALKADPGSADANTLLASIAEARGDAALAGKYYKAATESAPNAGIYANNYGGWLCANAEPAQSLGWFDRALADPTYPTPVFALTNAGNCARKAGQDLRAENSWRRALELQPENLAALSGMASLQLQRGRHLEARAFAQRWLSVAPDDRDGLRIAADIETRLGDNAAASRYLSRLQAIPPGQAPRTQ